MIRRVSRATSPSTLVVRSAIEADLNQVAAMVDDFVKDHPAANHPRPPARLRDAYFGAQPVAHLLVAEKRGRIVGMGQWTRIYDMFWGMYGARVEWLYVRPESRGQAIAAAIVAEICRQVREEGGEFLQGGADAEHVGNLYERVAAGMPGGRTVFLSAEAFQVFADLGGAPPRDIVRALPDPALNHVPKRPR
jgi:GNAT superfamily N-acetyltransferase